MNEKLKAAIATAIAQGGRFCEQGGQPFAATTETDLMRNLRDAGWRLPGPGYFMEEVRDCGFKVTQGQHFRRACYRVYDDGTRGRKVAAYNTLIY